METDKIPQKTSMTQAQLENEPIRKGLLNQKGSFLLILGVIIILVVFGTGRYFLMQKQNPEIPPSQIPTQQITSKFQGTAAFIRDDNLWVLVNRVEKQLTNDAVPTEILYWTGLPKPWYSNPQISPNGKQIAFLKNSSDNTYNRSLYVVDVDGNNMKQLTNDVDWGEPLIQWSKDNDEIFYTFNPLLNIRNMGDKVKIYSIAIATGNKQERGSYFIVEGGCGGGSPDVSAHLAQAEGISGIGSGVQVFQLSPMNDYLVHTVNCFGKGIAVLDLKSKLDSIINNDATKVVISPSGSMIAAITDKILILNAKTGKALKILTPSAQPTNLLWSPDEKEIYYSSVNNIKELSVPDDIALDVMGSGITYRVNSSIIREMSLDTQKDTKIIELDAHSLRLININKDRSKILVAVVENATKLHSYITQNKSKDDLVKYYPSVNLIEVNLNTGTSQTVLNKAAESSYLSE